MLRDLTRAQDETNHRCEARRWDTSTITGRHHYVGHREEVFPRYWSLMTTLSKWCAGKIITYLWNLSVIVSVSHHFCSLLIYADHWHWSLEIVSLLSALSIPDRDKDTFHWKLIKESADMFITPPTSFICVQNRVNVDKVISNYSCNVCLWLRDAVLVSVSLSLM